MQTFQALLGTELPVIQAPMAGSQASPLALAVCQAGGLGSLPVATLGAEGMVRELEAMRGGTDRPYNVNFFCHTPPASDPELAGQWRARLARYYVELGVDDAAPLVSRPREPYSEALAASLERFAPPIVSFHFGLPTSDQVARIKRWGAKVISSATTVEEARWLEAHGADAVIAQGLEAGGHRGHFLSDDLSLQSGTFALVPRIVSAVNIPVIAAGGIADARGVRAALALGAVAVQVGTAYLLTPEADTTPVHRAALLSAGSGQTALTNVISGRPARTILNRLVREIGPMAEGVPAFPLAASALAPLRAKAEARLSGDFSPLWAGQHVIRDRHLHAAALTHLLAGRS